MERREGAARGRALSVSLALVAALSGCGGPAERATADPTPAPAARFVEITREAGLSFDFDRARHDDYFMPDSMSAGCALFDYDGDDDLDVYIVNGYHENGAWIGPQGADRLLRQEPDGRFTDVTAEAGLGDPGYGMGVAVGDVDNDGDADLFVTNFGPDTLYRNEGNGTFTDVTARAGVGDPRWGASAGFFDYDADGFLDLFVSNYLDYDPALRVTDSAGRPEYPGPRCCPGAPDSLFHNRGDGTFEDVSATSGIGAATGRGLGVALLDLDGDGRLDVYVANDRDPNFAWIQQPDGTFVDRAQELGLAVNRYGAAEASMGIAIGDLDGDLTADLFLTNLFQETNTLYLGREQGRYDDATLGSGLGPPSLDFTGFGTAALDADLDGDLDLLVVNGRVLRSTPRPGARLPPHWLPYGEEGHLYTNDGAGHFDPDPQACGALCAQIQVGRGLALGDVDGDGDLDALTASGEGRVRLYRNTGPGAAHWIALRVLDRGRDALGAVVRVEAAGKTQRRDVSPVSSYLSSSDPRVHFGLGDVSSIDAIRVHWPGGSTEAFAALPVDRIHSLVRGTGRVVDEHE